MGSLSHHFFPKLPDDYRPRPLPKSLFRNFSKREYADDFLAGNIRLKTLSYYRALEAKGDVRGDEGDGTLIHPLDGTTLEIQDSKTKAWHPIRLTTGRMNVSATNPDHIMISCYSMVPTSAHYGAYQVEIIDVGEFLARICADGDEEKVGWGAVEYSDEINLTSLPRFDSARLWRSKRTRFEKDREFRIMIGHYTKGFHEKYQTYSGTTVDYKKFAEEMIVTLNIDDISDIAKLTAL